MKECAREEDIRVYVGDFVSGLLVTANNHGACVPWF